MAKSKNTILASLLTAAGDIAVSGSGSLTGDLTVQGRLTAQEYHSEIVSSSILYASGSTKFGDSADDIHQFTGSVNITGSLKINGVTLTSDGVTSFNTRTGAITLSSSDVTTALGYTPVTNDRTLTINGTTYDLASNRSWTVGNVRSDTTYSNPAFITSLSWSKITGTPTTLSAYGITDSYTQTQVNNLLSGYVPYTGATTNVNLGTNSLTGKDLTVGGSGTTSGILSFTQRQSASLTYTGTTYLTAAGTTDLYIYFSQGNNNAKVVNINVSLLSNNTVRYQYLPDKDGTFAMTSDLTGGTVTSVGLSSATSGVSINSTPITTSGTINLAIATASGSQQGLLSSTDWTTFNNKQNALTNPVTATGSRSTNYLPKFTSSNEITQSNIQDNGALVQVGTDVSSKSFKVVGQTELIGNTYMSGGVISMSNTAYAYAGLTTYGNLQSNGTNYLYSTTYLYGYTYAYNPIYITSGIYDLYNSSYYLFPANISSFYNTTTGDSNGSYGKIKINSSTFNGGLFGSPSITETISAPSSYNVPTKYFKVEYYWGTYTYGAWQGSEFRWYNNMMVYQNMFADKFITFGFSDNGTGAKLQIQGNGYVRDNFLIGTTTDSGYKLNVSGGTARIQNNPSTNEWGLFLQNTNTGGWGVSQFFNLYGYSSSPAGDFSVLQIRADYPAYGRATFAVKEQAQSTAVDALVLRGNGQVYMNAGNVGIGTTDPASKLSVHGQFRVNTTSGDGNENRLFFNPGGAGDPAQLYLYNEAQTNTIYITANGSSYFNGGSFGLGTTSPGDSKLAIRADWISGNGTVKTYPVTPISSGGATGYTMFDSDGTTRISYFAVNSGAIEVWGQQNSPMHFATNNSIKMAILANGNIGMGTTSPSQKLEVDGGSSAVTLRVSTTNTGAGASSLILANSSKSAFNDGVKISHGGGYTNITDLNGTNIMTWEMSSTRVGINTTTPSEKLHIVGNIQLGSTSNQYIRYRTQSAWDYYLKADFDDFVIHDSQNTEFFRAIYNGGGTGKYAQFLNSLRAHNNTNVTVLGTLTENSSIRYKDNVKTIEYGLDKVLQMRGVSYTKKDTGLRELGLIAEEVNEILPDVVLKNNEGEPDSVSYGRITAVLIEAIKDLQQQINVLNSK